MNRALNGPKYKGLVQHAMLSLLLQTHCRHCAQKKRVSLPYPPPPRPPFPFPRVTSSSSVFFVFPQSVSVLLGSARRLDKTWWRHVFNLTFQLSWIPFYFTAKTHTHKTLILADLERENPSAASREMGLILQIEALKDMMNTILQNDPNLDVGPRFCGGESQVFQFYQTVSVTWLTRNAVKYIALFFFQ